MKAKTKFMPENVKKYLDEEYNNLKNNPLNPRTKKELEEIAKILFENN